MRISGTAFEQRSLAAQRAERSESRTRVQPGQPFNWYEGGLPLSNGDRSYVPSIVQDARFDQNFVSRRELMRKARYWAQNNPVIKRILEVDSVYTVGANGLHLTPASSDSAWNKRAKEVWHELASTAGLEGEDIGTILHTAHPCERTDGEVFALKTRRRWTDQELAWRRGGVTGSRPCLQLVEAHRVETPMGRWGQEGDNIVDGVEVGKVQLPDGRKTRVKLGYWVRSSFGMFESDESWDLIPMPGVLHIGEAQRVGQLRYVSAFYAGMNVTHDFDDLQQCEMAAAKDGAEKSTIVKTPAGELNPASVIRARMRGEPTGNTETDEAWKKRVAFYQSVLKGRTLSVKTGDEVQQYLNNRPTVTSREYWLYLLSVICAGLGVSILLVFPDFSDNDQGTAIRAELDIANQLFIRRGRKWRRMVADTWEYFMGWAIYNDRRVVDPPADWRKVLVYPPRAANVDVGRNSQAMLAELGAGATDYELIYGPLGLDWEERFEKLAAQQKRAKGLGLQLVTGNQPANPQSQQDDEPPTPKRKKELADA